MKKILSICSLLVGFLPAAVSAEDARPQASQKPYEMMQKLAPLVGKWSMDTEITNDGGATWQKVPAQTVDVTFRHKDMLLAEVPATTEGPGFHMESYISYDQYRQSYRKAAVDDVWGIMDVYEGSEEEDTIVFTNMKSGTFFPIAEGVWRGFRLTMEVKRPVRRMMIEKTDDDGKSWQQAFRLTYTLVE